MKIRRREMYESVLSFLEKEGHPLQSFSAEGTPQGWEETTITLTYEKDFTDTHKSLIEEYERKTGYKVTVILPDKIKAVPSD